MAANLESCLSDQLRRIPYLAPRHLLALLILLAVGYVASRVPHLHHGPATGAGLPDPELYMAGLTGSGLWDHYKLAISLDGRHAESTIGQWGEVWSDWLGYLHSAGCRRQPDRCDRGEGCKGIQWHKAKEKHLKGFLDVPCRSGPREGLPKSTATRSAYTKAITGAYRWAVRKRLLSRDPFADVRAPRVGEGPPRSFTRAELGRILHAAAGYHDRRVYVLCWFGYHGLRCMEMAGLLCQDVRLDEEPQLLVNGKGGKQRPVPLHPLFVPVLGEWARGMTALDPLVVQHDNKGQPTVLPLKPSTVSALFSRFMTEEGIDGSAHWFRHTAATIMLDEGDGENLHHVQQFLGHASPTTTLRYVKAHSWNVRKWVDRMPDPRDPTRRVAAEPTPAEPEIAAQLRRVLTPEMSQRLSELPDDLAATYLPLLQLGSLLDTYQPIPQTGGTA
jgi:integrase